MQKGYERLDKVVNNAKAEEIHQGLPASFISTIK